MAKAHGPKEASDPALRASEVTPNDGADLPGGDCRSLWVGTGGNVKVTTAGGSTVTFTNVPDGFPLPVEVSRVWDTGTTASGIVALY